MKRYIRVVMFSLFFLTVLSSFVYITYQRLIVEYRAVQQLCTNQAQAITDNDKKSNPNDSRGILTDKKEIYFQNCMKREWNINRF